MEQELWDNSVPAIAQAQGDSWGMGRDPLPGHRLPEGPSCSLSSQGAGAACQEITSAQLFTRMNPHSKISTRFHTALSSVQGTQQATGGPGRTPNSPVPPAKVCNHF